MSENKQGWYVNLSRFYWKYPVMGFIILFTLSTILSAYLSLRLYTTWHAPMSSARSTVVDAEIYGNMFRKFESMKFENRLLRQEKTELEAELKACRELLPPGRK